MNDEQKAEKPDGFIAWHPKFGLQFYVSATHQNPEYALFDKVIEQEIPKRESRTLDVMFLKRYGWRIRPVKLVFLDED